MKRANTNIRKTAREAKRTRNQVQALALSMRRMVGTAAALTGAAGFTGLVRSAIQFGSAQSDIAGQLKINTTAFQVYAGAIRDAGGTQEQMRKSILSQTQAIVQGSEGLSTYKRAFERLNLNVHNLRRLKPETQFEMIAKAVANAKDQQGALTAVTEIYGKRNAPELIEVMERLARDGFGKVADEVRRTYGIMDAETQRRLDMAADRIEQFKQRATIQVGELIAGEANFAALKELGLRVMAVAARFGGRIVDAMLQSAQVTKAVYAAIIDLVAHRIKTAFETAMDSIRLKASKVMLDIQKFNPFMGHEKWLEALNRHSGIEREILEKRAKQNQEERKTWSDFFDKRMSSFVKTDVANSLGTFWDDLADQQRQILIKSQESAASAASSESAVTVSPTAPMVAKAKAKKAPLGLPQSADLSISESNAPLEGSPLAKAANKKKDGFRFQRQADGTFQRFVGGTKSGTFTENQLQKGLGQQQESNLKMPEKNKMTDGQNKESSLIEKMDKIINILEPLKAALSGGG